MLKKLACTIMSLLIAVSCMTMYRTTFSAAEDNGEVSAGSQSMYAQNNVQGGAILHCFCWSYDQIRQNMAAIANAGYSAVQTSPIQLPKDYMSGTIKGEWWKCYQPLSLSVANTNNWFGTKAKLKAMCDEAERYKIKVIVDIVANHVANNGSDGGGYANVNSNVETSLKNANYYHSINSPITDANRYTITQYHMGMPDLNTGNSYIQSRVLGLLKECVDLGVDGFRFDAAKHIELPTDGASYASNFWPYVTNGIRDYKSDVYLYGEILGSAGTATSNYTQYMSITEDVSSDNALTAAKNGNASSLKNYYLDKGENPNQAVMWAESHDTFMRDKNPTSAIANSYIVKAWGITGSRNDITTLYLARPGTSTMMGQANTSDTTWKSKEVTEINKFKNYFKGQSEYLSSYGNAAYNERGTSGVSISKLDGSGLVTLPAHTMAAGSYKDQISGTNFTVSGGYITGTVGSSGIAVVYNAPNEQVQPVTEAPTTVTVTQPTTAAPTPTDVLIGDVHVDGSIDIKDATMIQRAIAGYEELGMRQVTAADCDGNGIITINDTTELQRHIAHYTGNTRIGTTVSVIITDEIPQYSMTFLNSLDWTGTIYCYYWSTYDQSMVQWPGKPMTPAGTNSAGKTIYQADIPATAEKVLFTNQTYQTIDIPVSGSARYYAHNTTDSEGHYTAITW